MKKKLGFTLIELLIVVAIMAIVTIIAASVYTTFSRKSRRADGINALMAASLAEERYRSNNTSYGTLAQIGVSGTSAQGYYTIAVSGASATGYTVTATGTGIQASDTEGGTACNVLTLTVSNTTTTQAPAACWPS